MNAADRMNPRWCKVRGDLHEKPWQALLVALAIAVGSTAVATAFNARAILFRDVAASFAGTRPASAILWVDRVEPELVAQTAARPGVGAAEARRLVRARVEVTPGEWLPLRLFTVADFDDLRVSTFHRHSGVWPPPVGEMLVEQSCLSVLRTREGGSLRVRCPGGRVANLRVAGVVHDPAQAPGWQDQVGYAYVTPATLAALGEGDFLDELQSRLAPGEEDGRARAAGVAADLAGWLATKGRTVHRVEVPLGRHPHADHMRTMVTLLQVFGTLALILGGVLTAGVLAALLARQVRQIGVMKALGATSGQVAGIYGAYVLVLAGAGVSAGLSLGAVLGRLLARSIAPMLNLEVGSWSVPTGTLALEAALGLGIPLLAAAVPILRAARGMTAREALQHVGGAGPVAAGRRGRGLRLLALVPFVDRRVLLAFGNTFRRPVRLFLTLGALALGGALLLTAANVHSGLERALDDALAARGDDVDVRLLRPAPARALVERALTIPGVRAVEPWGATLVSVVLSLAGDEVTADAAAVGTDRYSLLCPPSGGSRLLHLPLAGGRWPEPGEADAVVVNSQLLARERTLPVGAAVALRVGARSYPVRVVGVAAEVGEPAIYTNAATFRAAVNGNAGTEDLAGGLRLVTAPGTQARVAAALEESLVGAGSFPGFLMTRENLRRALSDHFVIILLLLGGVALASVAVGGLGLATSMGLNVLERGREIGVLRALGATRRDVLGIVALEGAALAALSVVGAVKLSVPLSLAVGWLVGRVGLHAPVPLVISPGAIFGWVVLTALVTAAACLVPARRALRLSVRETLAHE